MVNFHVSDGKEYLEAVKEIQYVFMRHDFMIVEALGILDIVRDELHYHRNMVQEDIDSDDS